LADAEASSRISLIAGLCLDIGGKRGLLLAAGETTIPHAVQQLPNHKVKIKKPGQRACNEKDEKGKFCGGHLKRWFYAADAVEQECGCIQKAWGPDAEVYRCEICKTLYLPNPESARGVNVAGEGQISVFGLTLPPKEEKK
jgi:hypothetical protein